MSPTTERPELDDALYGAVLDALTDAGHGETECRYPNPLNTTTNLIVHKVLDALRIEGPTVDVMARAAAPGLFGRPDSEVGPATRSERRELRRRMRAALAVLTAHGHIPPRTTPEPDPTLAVSPSTGRGVA